jgi:hypothetical protein
VNNINDLLKSLVLQDQGGGQVSTVSYDNRDPVEKALKSFAIDLTNNPTMGALLNQTRGEQVEVTRADQLGAVSGAVVGVEKSPWQNCTTDWAPHLTPAALLGGRKSASRSWRSCTLGGNGCKTLPTF